MDRMTPTQPDPHREFWTDYAGNRQGFQKPPEDNGFVDDLRKSVVDPAFGMFQELDAARANARKRGLTGFELHEDAGDVRPRVHQALLAAAEKVETRKAGLTALKTDLTRFRADPAPEARERYAAVRAAIVTDPQSMSGVFELSIEEAEAILAESPPRDRRRWEAAQTVWLRHQAAENPGLLDAIKIETEALFWAAGVLNGLLHLAQPPTLAKA